MHALDHASMHISPGEFVSIIGPSGSGKSTMMNIIGCLDVADSGEYLLDGLPIEQYSERELTRVRNRKIGFIFQNFNLIQRMTAEENVELPLIYQGVRAAQRRQRVWEALERVGLSKRGHHRPTELSGGQQQRVAIARAVAHQPAVLFADEPTAELDTNTGLQVMKIFKDLCRDEGVTVIMTTHDTGLMEIGDQVYELEDGEIIG